MNLNVLRVCGPATILLFAVACGSESPLQPSPSASGVTTSGVTTSSATAPQLLSPADGSKVAFAAQPLTITIGNGVSTGSTSPTYTFEVATDAAFTKIVSTKSGVAQGSNGKTSVTLDALAASTTFFWRARTVTGSDQGPAPKPASFTIGAQVTLGTPTALSPTNGSTATGTANLVVNNVARTGPAGPISYLFQISDSSSFSRIVASATVSEQGGNTTTASFINGLTTNTNYFWRVQASDPANFLTTSFSSVAPFKFVLFDMSQARILNNPQDLASWAQTATITSINFTDSYFAVDFDKREGFGRWPDVGFGDGALEYTLGMCVNPSGSQWFCSAVVQFWNGRDLSASGSPHEIGINWFYDGRWAPILGYQPAYGETVGIFVAAGNLRDSGNVIVKERSNVVLMPFGDSYSVGANSLATRPLSLARK